jgi:hypothetical protein
MKKIIKKEYQKLMKNLNIYKPLIKIIEYAATKSLISISQGVKPLES